MSMQSELVYECRRREDGGFPTVNDPRWEQLPAMELVDIVNGQKQALPTSVESFWDEEALYFRFTCEDDHIVATMRNHDDPIYEEDVVEVFISETGDLTAYKEFETSPANVTFDAQIHNDNRGNIRIETEWEADGWQTEAFAVEPGRIIYIWKIPFAVFDGGAPAAGDRWRMNAYRIDRGKDGSDAYSAWSATGKINFHLPEKFGVLYFC